MLKKALRVSCVYLVFGAIWIITSDWLVHRYFPGIDRVQSLQTAKGLLFVAISTIVIFLAAWRELKLEHRYQLKLSAAESQLHQVAERTSDLVYTFQRQPERRFTYVSPSVLSITGYSQQDHYRDAELSYKIVHPEDRPLLDSLIEPGNEGKPFKLRWIHKSGKIVYIEVSNVALRDENGNIVGVSGMGRDVTQAEIARQELEHLNHAYAVLWQVNRLIVNQGSALEIYREACAIPLSSGNFSLVWVGLVNRADNRLELVCRSGNKVSYLDGLKITLDDSPTGRGPTGLAARMGKAYWSTDIATDDSMAPWRARALANGFRSSAAFPLKIDRQVTAVWTLYSPVAGYFTEAVQRLYQQLAGDISFALQNLANKAEKEKLVKYLEISTKRWQFAVEASGEGLWDWNLKTDEVYFSETIASMLGYTLVEWGNNLEAWHSRLHPDDRATVVRALQDHIEQKTAMYSTEHRLLCKDGTYLWILDRGRVIERGPDGEAIRMIGLHKNIDAERGERLRVQQQEEKLKSLIEEAPIGIATVDATTGKILSANAKYCEILKFSESELKSMTWQSLIIPADIAEGERLVRTTLTGKSNSFSQKKRLRRGDNKIIWVDLKVKRLQPGPGIATTNLAMIEDITALVDAEARLRLDAAVISHTRDGVVITSLEPKIVSVNQAYCDITGYSTDEVVGKNPSILQSGRQDRDFYAAMWREIKSKGRWQGELYNRRKNGEIYPQISTIDTIYNAEGKPEYYVGVFSDISKLKDSEESFERLARYDVLTGLPNRLMVTNRLAHAVASAGRHRRMVAVLFMDLDHFKNVNDSLGHVAGDELLAAVAMRLKARLRAEDTIARLGGDEFIVLLEDIESAEHAALVARDLLSNLSAPFELASEHEIYSGGSIGISIYPQDGENPHELIRNADAAMYLAKSEGRNTFRFYTQSLTDAARKRLALEAALRRALERGELYVKYQPIVDIASGVIVGAEALCRWRTAEGEEISLAVARTWAANQATFKTMAVNFSVRQFQSHDWYERFSHILRESGVAADRVEVEITESDIMQKSEEGIEVIRELHSSGVRIAIDDFGTGYSSLSYLQRFSVNKMKIDQSFVRDLPESAAAAQLVRTMIRLGKSLGLEIQAEGVETEAQRQFLLAEGCDTYQGYLTSPPVTAEEFAAKFL